MNYNDGLILSKALTKLFKPFCEVVIHDIEVEQIHHIEGRLTERAPGDLSRVDIKSYESNMTPFIRHEKACEKGQTVKSVSIPLQTDGALSHFMCINFHLSFFEDISQTLSMIMDGDENKPQSLFKPNFREHLNLVVRDYLQEKSISFDQLKPKNKKEVAHILYQQGIFDQKKSVPVVSEALNMGRATLFNYLNEWR